ncbi:MAG: HIT family protein [Halobacteria archaeon]
MAAGSCIFCEIASGERPARKVLEAPRAMAFLDAFPLVKGHTLVIPRAHAERAEGLNPEDAGALFQAVSRVAAAVQRATGAPSTTLMVNNGVEAGQVVMHVHVHVVPRFAGDPWGNLHTMVRNRANLSPEEMEAVAASIRKRL